jgi:hypothetical protein
VGQVTQPDPIGLAGGMNLYGYANGDPVNFADPFGLYADRQDERGSIHERLADDVREDADSSASEWWAKRAAEGKGSRAVNNVMGGLAALWEALNEDPCPDCAKAEFNVAIGGSIRGFTKHGINQAISRNGVGVTQAAMRDAVTNPLQVVQQQGGTVLYIGRDARVVLNVSGEVVTTMARNRSAWRILP